MRTSIIIFGLILCCSNSIMKAQDTIRKKMINPTSVTLISDTSLPVKGALFQVNDASIMISHSTSLNDYTHGNFNVSEIDVIDIELIKTYSRTRARTGAVIGASAGLAYLFAMSLRAGYDFENAAYSTLLAGIVFAPFGAVAGGLIGSIKIKIPISGSMDNYNRNKARLNKYALKKQEE